MYLSDLGELTFDALASEVKRSTFELLREEPDKDLQFEVILSYIHELGPEIRITSTKELTRAVIEYQKSGVHFMRIFAGVELANKCRGELKCLAPKAEVTPQHAPNAQPMSQVNTTRLPQTTSTMGIAPVASLPPPTPVKLEMPSTVMPLFARKRKQPAATTSSTKKKKRSTSGSVANLILNALMELRALNITEPSKVYIGLMSGYTNTQSAGFVKQLSALKSDGMITLPNGKCISLTQKAVGMIPAVEAPKTNKEVQDRLRATLKAKSSKSKATRSDEVFEALQDGKTMTKKDLGTLMHYTNIQSAGFTKVLSQLSGLKLLEVVDKSSVRLSDICFPYGRPTPGIPPGIADIVLRSTTSVPAASVVPTAVVSTHSAHSTHPVTPPAARRTVGAATGTGVATKIASV